MNNGYMELEYHLEKLEKISMGTYWDIRLLSNESNKIILKDGSIEEISSGMNTGVIVRVLYKNGWGYANSNRIDIKEIRTF